MVFVVLSKNRSAPRVPTPHDCRCGNLTQRYLNACPMVRSLGDRIVRDRAAPALFIFSVVYAARCRGDHRKWKERFGGFPVNNPMQPVFLSAASTGLFPASDFPTGPGILRCEW